MKGILHSDTARWVEDFLAFARPTVTQQGYTALQGSTQRLAAWFDREDIPLPQVQITDAVRCQAWLSAHRQENGLPLSPGTIQNYLKTARRLFDYLVTMGQLAGNPFRELANPRVGEHLSAKLLGVDQMGKLLSHLARFDEAAARERSWRYRLHVLAELLYATGLRCAEAASLEPGDLDLEQGLVHLKAGKNGRSRTAWLTTYAAGVLGHFLSHRQEIFGHHERQHAHALFGMSHHALGMFLNEYLARVCSALGLPVLTSHSFRHCLGTHLLQSGCDLRHIQIILGHESLASTQIYTKVHKDHLRQVVDQAHPRASWKGGKA